MEKRFKMHEMEPEGYKAILGLEKFINGSELTTTHKELIKIRASQINGCAFCLDMHSRDARKYGETEKRIYTLSAWRETNFFTPEEQALLALTEEVTLISDKHVSDKTFNEAVSLLGEKYVAQAILLIATINVWNRVAIATHLMPE